MSLISNILSNSHTFAVVGVSQDRQKYGHEVFEALLAKGYQVYPINPKYEEIDGHRCYPSLADLPEQPDVVVTVVPPAVTEQVVESCTRLGVGTVWMPPGSWSQRAVEICETQGIEEVHDVCLVFALRSL
ncbi:MAG: CoA-binding protein [Anaerolineae bacterium]|jgi:predicted CoA-binding protein|nr:CoA-binding protein [Anaerolineae bacterium]MDH7475227.1 CoA-binding protein [Anaerolineae bacterium]